MFRRRVTAAVVASCLAVLGACSGSDEPKPKASASTSATPTTAPQPEGADGITYDIQNWDEYADDPVVLAWKQSQEGLGASIDAKKVVPTMRSTFTEKALRAEMSQLRDNWANNRTSKSSVAPTVIRSVKVTGDRAVVESCVWGPATSLYVGDKAVDPLDAAWYRYTDTMVNESGWKFSEFGGDGRCKELKAP